MRILLAEDDAALAQRLLPLLEQAGYVVEVVADGRQAEEIGQFEDLQAAIVDLGLPGLDGLSVIERWRGNGRSFPVLILTARGRWHDKLAGFDAGADDYLTKPFQPDELVLRLRALIRRSHGHASPRLHCGPLQLDVNAGRFELDGQVLPLSPQEFRVLSYFIHHTGSVISRDRLGEQVFEGGYDPDSNALDVLLGRLRRKLGIDLIHTVRGQGWRLAEA
ncbi:response regulator transcription factor [Stenotrophomonas riyadhensis]|uniref:Response regulator transcription factor n=1 Tax=Stenotrophomonas maltophilia TaxID=40324 RepID=A0AAI9C030_STEMA|nr:response regulator transcription factor [Stenotrophomonas maltophilia]HEL4101810.1 response regulator transcription factor [Stenotrophomonas maltophilia]HEL5042776.1 response regulator transcription factor [Stenotrophomonas maltophilia]